MEVCKNYVCSMPGDRLQQDLLLTFPHKMKLIAIFVIAIGTKLVEADVVEEKLSVYPGR